MSKVVKQEKGIAYTTTSNCRRFRMKLIHLFDLHNGKKQMMSMVDVCPVVRMGCE